MNFNFLKKLIFDIKELALSQVLILVLLFIQIGVVTRGLGAMNYGRVALIMTLIALVFRTLHARNSDVTLLMLNKNNQNIYTVSLFFDLAIGLLSSLICVIVFKSNINQYFGNYNLNLLLYFLLFTRIFQTFSESSKAILTFHGKFKRFALVESTSTIARFLTIILLFYFNKTIESYLIGQAVYSIFYGFFSLYISREYFKYSELSANSVKDYFYAFKLDFLKQRVDQLVGIIPQHLDLVILGYFTDFSTVGIFRIAKRFVEPLNSLITILNPYIQNKLSNNSFKISSIKDLLINVLLPISSILTVLYIFFGKFLLVFISGEEFVSAYTPMLILLLGYLIYLMTFWTRQILLFNNLIHYHSVSRVLSLLTFLILSIIFVNLYKANGIALALSISMIFQKIFEYYIIKKQVNL